MSQPSSQAYRPIDAAPARTYTQDNASLKTATAATYPPFESRRYERPVRNTIVLRCQNFSSDFSSEDFRLNGLSHTSRVPRKSSRQRASGLRRERYGLDSSACRRRHGSGTRSRSEGRSPWSTAKASSRRSKRSAARSRPTAPITNASRSTANVARPLSYQPRDPSPITRRRRGLET